MRCTTPAPCPWVPTELIVIAVTTPLVRVAVALGSFVQVPPETVIAGADPYPEPPLTIVAIEPVLSTVAVARVPATLPGPVMSSEAPVEQVIVDAAGGASIVTWIVPAPALHDHPPAVSGIAVINQSAETVAVIVPDTVQPDGRPVTVTCGGFV